MLCFFPVLACRIAYFLLWLSFDLSCHIHFSDHIALYVIPASLICSVTTIRCSLCRRHNLSFPLPHFLCYNSAFFSKTLSFALLARLFASISSSDGRIGFRVITFPLEACPHTHTGKSGEQVQGFSFRRKAVFTIRSSSE